MEDKSQTNKPAWWKSQGWVWWFLMAIVVLGRLTSEFNKTSKSAPDLRSLAKSVPTQNLSDATYQSTKACVAELQMAILDRNQLFASDPIRALTTTQVRLWQLDKRKCDPVIADCISEFSAISGDLAVSLEKVLGQAQSYRQGIDSATQWGATLGGSLNEDNPYGGAVGGALLLGLLQAGATEEERQQIIAQYQAEIAEHDRRWNACSQKVTQRLIEIGIK